MGIWVEPPILTVEKVEPMSPRAKASEGGIIFSDSRPYDVSAEYEPASIHVPLAWDRPIDFFSTCEDCHHNTILQLNDQFSAAQGPVVQVRRYHDNGARYPYHR